MYTDFGIDLIHILNHEFLLVLVAILSLLIDLPIENTTILNVLKYLLTQLDDSIILVNSLPIH